MKQKNEKETAGKGAKSDVKNKNQNNGKKMSKKTINAKKNVLREVLLYQYLAVHNVNIFLT